MEVKEKTSQQALANLRSAVLYLDPDGTEKLCGNRCMMHVESGEYKDRCTIHGPDVFIPNKASCGFYVKGDAAKSDDHMMMKLVTPKQSGLIYGKVQCKRCLRRGDKETVCAALTKVLQDQGHDIEFSIKPDACCNWQLGENQTTSPKNDTLREAGKVLGGKYVRS